MNTARTYSEKVAHTLKHMLLEGKLAPGQRVNEAVLAAELGVSRAPIREALHMLVAEGLVVNLPQRGKFITALTPQEICNSYFVGGVLEGAAAAQCAKDFDQQDFERMAEVLGHMQATAARGGTMQELAPLDTSFHDIIFSRVNNPLLVEVSRRSCLRVSKFLLYPHWLSIYTPEEFCARHEHVLDTLRARDPHNIEVCLREHYSEAGQRLAPFGALVKQGTRIVS